MNPYTYHSPASASKHPHGHLQAKDGSKIIPVSIDWKSANNNFLFEEPKSTDYSDEGTEGYPPHFASSNWKRYVNDHNQWMQSVDFVEGEDFIIKEGIAYPTVEVESVRVEKAVSNWSDYIPNLLKKEYDKAIADTQKYTALANDTSYKKTLRESYQVSADSRYSNSQELKMLLKLITK